MIKIRDLRKEFKGFNISVDCKYLNVDKGCAVGIYGCSGSGKTLFSLMLSGIIKKYEGTIKTDLNELKNTFRKKIGYLPYSNILYTGLTVEEMSKFLLGTYKIKESEYDLKREWFCQFFDISSLDKRKIFTLSGGELQMIKLFSAVIHSPSNLIMDEPFNGIGEADLNKLSKLIEDLKNRKVSVIAFSSHKTYLDTISDRTRTITQGKLN